MRKHHPTRPAAPGIIYRASRTARLLALTALLLAVMGAPTRGLAQTDGCAEPNDDLASACAITSGVPIKSYIERTGDIDTYTFSLDAGGGLVALELIDLPADYDLYLLDDNNQIFAQGVHEGTTPELVTLAMPAGTFYVMVTADSERPIDSTRPYTLLLLVTATVGAVPTPHTVPVSAVEGRPILVQDDFDDPTRARFPLGSAPVDRFNVGYVDGEYDIRNVSPQNQTWGIRLPDVGGELTLAVDARFIGPTARRYLVLTCRDQAVGAAAIRPGYRMTYFPATREVLLRRGDVSGTVTLSPQRVTAAAKPDNESNHFEFSCIGSTISVRINGQAVTSVTDDTYRGGQSWIVIGGNVDESPRAEIRLDNLAVYGP